ncbi:MAG: amino acid permease [Proteobacteria bacterium]|nr:amino acid permease [Pseudomonadota bacterium]MCP4917308.1 amino acid permease [Pseudomonadota bacterium]
MARTRAKQLDRNLGFLSVYSLAVGAMLGSGIFVLPGLAAAVAGPYVALSYLLAGLLVLPALLSKAEMATAMPVAGGTYVYVDRSMGPWMGTITGLGTWISLSSKSAFALVGLGSYMVLFADLSPTAVALVILGLLLTLNALGSGKASALQIVIVGTTIVALSILAAGGTLVFDPALLEPAFPQGGAGIVAGAGFVFVSYSGVTKICSVAEEVRNPDRNIPLGMLGAQATVMTLYVIIAFVLAGTIPLDKLGGSTTPIALLGGAVFGDIGRTVFSIVAIAGLVSMCNAGVLSTTRFPFAMARDRLLPDVFKSISKRFRTPIPSIILTGVLLIALVTVLPVVTLAKMASGFKIFVFCIVNLALIVLRESGARWYKPSFKSPLYPWVQLAGILGGIWLLTQLGTKVVYGVGGATVLGTAWYFAYARKRVERSSVIKHVWGERHALKATLELEAEEDADEHVTRVVVPVFGHEPAPGHLMRLAAGFVEEGVLEVVRFEEIPETIPLVDDLEPDEVMTRLERQAELIAEDLHLPVEFHDVRTHNAMEALLHHAQLTRAEWIVMEPRRVAASALIKNPLAWWLDHVPCDVALLTDRSVVEDEDAPGDGLEPSPTQEVLNQPFERILVLAEPGPYDSICVRMADELARRGKGQLTLFHSIPPGGDGQVWRDYHDQLQALCTVHVHSMVPETEDPVRMVAELSRDYDLIVLGAPKENTLKTLFFGSIEHEVVKRASCSVLKIKAPRDAVHHRLSEKEDRYDLRPVLDAGFVETGVVAARREELFAHMATKLSMASGIDAQLILSALQKRERRQSTALRSGISLTAPTASALRQTVVGVFVMAEPVPFGRRRTPVDICVVTAGPPDDRRKQLRLLAQLSERVSEPEVAARLRQAKDPDEVREILLSVTPEGT